MTAKIIDITMTNDTKRAEYVGETAAKIACTLNNIDFAHIKTAGEYLIAIAEGYARMWPEKRKSPVPRQRKQGKPLKSTIEIKG